MCEQCDVFDAAIAHYRRLKEQINDRQAQEAAAKLAAELEAKKATLHPK
jgi:hypothetical protein